MTDQPEVPAGAQAERCPDCKGWFFMADCTQGKGIPLQVNAAPVGARGGGNVTLMLRGTRRPLAYVERNPGKLFGKTQVYTLHRDTCPKAKRTARKARTS